MLLDNQIAKIEKQRIPMLETAFRQLCSDEVELENKLSIIREVKARILITIEKKLNNKSEL